jgi:hypothetical protein
LAALYPDIAASEQKVKDLAEAAGCTGRNAMGIAGSLELFGDEMKTPVPHRPGEIALPVQLRSARYLGAQLTQAKAGGCELLGHPRNRSLLFFTFRCGAYDSLPRNLTPALRFT